MHGRKSKVKVLPLARKVGMNCDKVRTMTIEQIQQLLKRAHSKMNSIKKETVRKGESWLEELCDSLEEMRLGNAQVEMKHPLTRERQRKDARAIKRVTKANKLYGLSLLQVAEENGQIREVTEKEEMETILCSELTARFTQASATPLATTPLLEMVGDTGTGERCRSNTRRRSGDS
jgi:hypothetical protein